MTQGGRAARVRLLASSSPTRSFGCSRVRYAATTRSKLKLVAVDTAGGQAPHEDAAPAEVTSPTRRRYARRAGSGTFFGAAQPLAILFHHRAQHLLAGLETETEERGERVGEHIEQWQRHLNRGDGRGHERFPGRRSRATLLHGGCSF